MVSPPVVGMDGSGTNAGRCAAMVKTHATEIAGLWLLESVPAFDDRGYFARRLDQEALEMIGSDLGHFVYHSVSRSHQGVVRGLHGRRDPGETKIVSCVRGTVFDVVVDNRRASATYGQWRASLLDGDRIEHLLIPAGCLHGFQATTDVADLQYLIDRPHEPALDQEAAFDDPGLGINWPLAPQDVSARDLRAPRFGAVAPSALDPCSVRSPSGEMGAEARSGVRR
jgi:dTDP-4-dehydrorhamnose 3,5-epimerase